MTDISNNIIRLQEQIRNAAITHHRDPSGIQLVAVSKTKPAAMIQQAYECGLTHFGENYLQEALEKINTLQYSDICWHFIGPIQSNKTRKIAENFHWVHTVDNFKLAQRLSKQRPAELGSLNLCIQVNISGESSKSGVLPTTLYPLVEQVLSLPKLRLRGLMAIPAPIDGINAQREPFRRLRDLLAETEIKLRAANLQHLSMDLQHLSMGMSADLEAAIAEGATFVRIGTAIFGRREPKPKH